MVKKFTIVLTTIFLFTVVFLRENFNYLNATTLLVSPTLFFCLYKLVIFVRSIYFKIWRNILSLNQQIKENKDAIYKLQSKSDQLEDRLGQADNISQEIKLALEENISLWKAQIVVHQDIISLLNLRIDRLKQHRAGITLLEYTVGQIRSEPDKAKLINQLESLIRKVDGKVDRDITRKITSLMKDLALNNREARIVNMSERLAAIKQKVVI